MSDDLRERQPERDLGDNPPEDGIRSDVGATATTGGGVAAGGPAVGRADARIEGAMSGSAGEAPPDPLADVEHPTADE